MRGRWVKNGRFWRENLPGAEAACTALGSQLHAPCCPVCLAGFPLKQRTEVLAAVDGPNPCLATTKVRGKKRDGRSHSVSTSCVSRHCLPHAVLTRCHQTWRNPWARQWGQASVSVFQLCFSFLTVPIEKTSLVRQQDDTSSILMSSWLSKPMEGRLLPMWI